MTAIELSRVGPEQATALLELARAFHAEDGHPLSERGAAAIGMIASGHPLGRAWLIEEAGQPSAMPSWASASGSSMAAPTPSSTISTLCRLARGRGHRRACTRAAGGRGPRAGPGSLFLVVDPDNGPARRLYDRAGFEDTHWLLMAKRL